MELGFGFSVGGGWPANGSPGGEEPPAWARAGSIADIDFVNDPFRAWTSTGGETNDPTDIFGDSALLGVTFDPETIVAGVGMDAGAANAINELATAFMFDFTVVVEFDDGLAIEYAEPNFDTNMVLTYWPEGVGRLTDDSSGTSGGPLLDATGANGTLGPHKIAFTIKAGECYMAIDGVSAIAGGVATTYDPSTPTQPTDIKLSAAPLKRVTIYNPVKTEAEQRTLTA